MSEFFVKTFNKKHKCLKCKSAKLKIGRKVFSLCKNHLDHAKLRWRQWQTDRQKNGKCCYCNKKSFNGFLRCKTHTEYNKTICNKWILKNKEYKKIYGLSYRQENWRKEFER